MLRNSKMIKAICNPFVFVLVISYYIFFTNCSAFGKNKYWAFISPYKP